MTKMEALAQLQSALPALSAEQTQLLAELADAWTREHPTEDVATRAAIAEGIAQADRGERISTTELDNLLGRPWR